MKNVLTRVTTILVANALLATNAYAQACFGAPDGGAIAYEHVRYSVGTGHGGSASTTLGRVAVGAFGNTRSQSSPLTTASGFEGTVRTALVLSMGRVRVCPGLMLGFASMNKSVMDGLDMSDRQLTGRAGVAAGLEQHLYRGLTLIPALGVHYEYQARVFEVDAEGGENATTGDTLSRVAIDYSLALRYRFLWAGASALRYTDGKGARPVRGRFAIGMAFGSARATAPARSQAIVDRRRP